MKKLIRLVALSGLVTSGLGLRAAVNDPIVFVSRQIPDEGSIYYGANGMAGVGAQSRFINASPGKLQIRQTNGTITTLIDGASPSAASLNLIDVNAPDVSFDATQIVFAGLPSGSHSRDPLSNPGAWRIYVININGTGLRQVTFSTPSFSTSQLSGSNLGGGFDDTDPCWLPDGRIAFSSTRYPAYAQYSGVRASNLYMVNADGSNLHRITSERNGADRPLIDPITGKIVYARWWRNHRFAINDPTTVPDTGPRGGFVQKDGLTTDRDNHVGGADNLFRNAWQIATINPDGTGLAMWGGFFRREDLNHMYGGGFAPDGTLYSNHFPMYNMTEAAGFGGIRSFTRGAGTYTGVIGIHSPTQDYVKKTPPESFGIEIGNYASDPAVLPDGTLLISWAVDTDQDYGLYNINSDGSGLTAVYDNANTAELRAKVIRDRTGDGVPTVADTVTQMPSLLPPTASGPYDKDGTFVFDALNVYANAAVDMDIVSAPPVGSANKIQFFADFQRSSPGSFPMLDWPILLGEAVVNPDGSVRESQAPANISLFETIRSADGTVPRTRGANGFDGAAHVAGMNFGRPGIVARCVGCHAGHTMIPVPATDEEAKWTNLAPGAVVTASSGNNRNGVIDRRVLKGNISDYWSSASGQKTGQWVQLSFPVQITVRTVRLYNPRAGANVNVTGATVRVFSDSAGAVEVASTTVGALAAGGTDAAFSDVPARVVRIELAGMTGSASSIGLAEVEVIGRGEEVAGVGDLLSFRVADAYTFPNPAVNRRNLTFHVEATGAEDVAIRVYNDAGTKIYQASLDGAPIFINGLPSYEHTWDILDVPSGTYMWTITALRGQETIRATRKLAIIR